mmetsp:Transcript_5682/g.9522  ORF Transcript_5682/g.9522 Transcript_5682/m.9522 type:complete len:155 (+) Transcript_5682:21-485(+)
MSTKTKLVSLAVIGVGAAASLYATCPSEESFEDFFRDWCDHTLWPIIKEKMKANGGDRRQKPGKSNKNKLVEWVKSAANKATDTIEKGLLLSALFPDGCQARFEMYHVFRTAAITMYTDQFPRGIELIFIGVGNTWFLNPVQRTIMYFDAKQQT